MATVTINGHTYTDDASPTTGLGGGGHRARFIPLISDVVTVLGTVAASGSITINRALVSNGSGQVAASSVTSTEMGYLSGVTSAVQTQLNAKAPLASPTFDGVVEAPAYQLKANQDTPYNSGFSFWKQRGSIAAPTIVQNGDQGGPLGWRGYDGVGYTNLARIDCLVDGTPGTNVMPGGLVFYTNPGADGVLLRMKLNAAGNLLLNTATDDASGAKLQVSGTINLASGNAYKINNQQVVGARQAAIANASVAYTTGNLDTEGEIISALNTTNGKINSILTALRNHGLIAP